MSAVLRAIVDDVVPVGLGSDRSTTRLAYSAEEREAQERIARHFADPRFDVSRDAAGNLWVVLRGRRPELPRVLTGSHLDSVPAGGMWDGALGVYTAAAALLTLADGPRALRSIALVAFASEESPRFDQSAYRFGSRAIAGRIDPGDPFRFRDRHGVLLADAMTGIGIDPNRVAEARIDPATIHAVVELHIDQGRTLIDDDVSVAVVEAITGSCRLRVLVEGKQDHSGAARMPDRRDALTAAAAMVLAIEAVGVAEPERLVTTVGWIEARPGAVSVVPGACAFTVDIRSVDGAVQTTARAAIIAAIAAIAAERAVQSTVDTIRDVAPVEMDPAVGGVCLGALEEAGLPRATAPSHAGHDTGSFAGIARLGMLFVRNRSGRSHVLDEAIDWNDALDGERALTAALRRLADEPEEGTR